MHAVIYSDGYCVVLRMGGRTASFPFLSVPEEYKTAWNWATHWARNNGAESIEYLRGERK